MLRVAAALAAACILGALDVKSLDAQAPTPSAQAISQPQSRPVRLRVAWGGGDEARRWSGRITLSDGTLSDLQLLGMEFDAAGGIWQENNVIYINAIRPHRFDGFDVTVTPGNAAKLSVELISPGPAAPLTVVVPVADVARQVVQRSLDDKNNRLLIHRSPGDLVRVETDRQELIFSPGEQFAFTLRPAPDELNPGATVDVLTTLTPARGGKLLWSDSKPRQPVPPSGDFSAAVNVPLPREQGVYTVRIALTHPPGFRRIIPGTADKPFAERSFQVAVLNATDNASAAEVTWQTVLEIDPANPRWWQLLPSLMQRLPGIPRGPLGSVAARAIDHPLGRFVELPPTPLHGEPHWQAYPLPLEAIGAAHILEVEYPADQEQHFGLSIVEPNAAGKVVPIGRDSGVYAEGLGRTEQTERHTHRFVFWPRTNSPLLLITNLHPTAAAHFGSIRVRRANGSLAGAYRQPPWQRAERLVTAYVERPLLPETFGASEVLDAATGQSVDDYETYFQATQRLADYLPYAGYNGAVVNVLADGSAIYPSRQLMSTPLYNTGRMVGGANDVPPTDALELLLRVFDRQGLALLPALQFATPLPALESLRRTSDPQQSGLEWVGPDGRTWLQSQGTSRGLAPYYNLLDDRVQQAMLDVVQELVSRYGHHASLAGLAVQLSGDGFAQLPGPAWGLDDTTFARFQRDTGIQLPIADGPNRFAARRALVSGEYADAWRAWRATRAIQFDDATFARFERDTGIQLPIPDGPNRLAALRALVSGEYADAWRAWRATRVTQFYNRLAALLQADNLERRLLLTTEEMFSSPRVKAQLQPKVLTKVRLDRMLLESGIDRDRLERISGITLCPAQYIEPMSPLVDRAIDLEINEAILGAAARAAKDSPAGVMFFHRPLRTRLASFDSKSPWPSSTWLVSQSSADATAVRRRFATALSQGAPSIVVDGGELLPMGQEDATRHVLRAFQQLPASGEGTIHQRQPITVRSYASDGGTTLVVVNESPWRTEAEVTLELPFDADIVRLTGERANMSPEEKARSSFAAGKQTWPLRLDAYDVEVVRFSTGGVRVSDVSAKIGDAAKAELESRIAACDRDLTKRSVYNRLSNGGFEATGGSPLPGWQFAKGPGLTAELDATSPHGGKSSLYLSSRGQLATVESELMPTPATGQMFLTVWLRGENLAPNAELRMVFQTEGPEPFSKFAVVGPKQAGQPLGPEWQHNGFWVPDLPLDSKGQMRVKFELDGAGEVWVDDVQLYDLLFPFSENEYVDSTAEKTELLILQHAVQSKYDEGKISDCVRLLDNYWLRFLMAYTPRAEAQPAIARQTPAPKTAPPPEKPAETPTDTASGWRKIWPFR